MKIINGPNKGYYSLPVQIENDNSLIENDTVYSKLRLPPNNPKIHGFNKTYLSFINGYYYVPKNDELDVRKLIYSLENQLVPSSGNTETFLRQFQQNVIVPDDWCPEYLDPCNYRWCTKCKGEINNTHSAKIDITAKNKFKRGLYIFCCMIMLSIVIVLSLRSL